MAAAVPPPTPTNPMDAAAAMSRPLRPRPRRRFRSLGIVAELEVLSLVVLSLVVLSRFVSAFVGAEALTLSAGLFTSHPMCFVLPGQGRSQREILVVLRSSGVPVLDRCGRENRLHLLFDRCPS